MKSSLASTSASFVPTVALQPRSRFSSGVEIKSNSDEVLVMTINCHLFGRLARVGEGEFQRETPFYYRDFKRISALADYIEWRRPRYVGLQEIWDPLIQHQLAGRLKASYPYQMRSPWANGIPHAIEAIGEVIPMSDEFIERKTNTIIRKLAQNHYQISQSLVASLMGRIFSEDFSARIVQKLFNVQDLFGAGLMFFSQDPIEPIQSHFYPHEVKAGQDRFTKKGIQRAVVLSPQLGPLTFLNGHFQEGTSKKAVATRTAQIRSMRRLIDDSDFPAIAMGDFNVARDTVSPQGEERRRFPRPTDEYRRMMDILNLRDAYAGCNREHLRESPGVTYLHDNYARKKGVPDTTREQAMTVDYILHDTNFETLEANVDNDCFFLVEGERRTALSDHRPVIVKLKKRHALEQIMVP